MIHAQTQVSPSDDCVPTLRLPEPISGGPWRISAAASPAAGASSAPRRGVTLAPGRTITIGAHVGCDLSIDDPAISARHVALSAGPCGVVVEDLGSKNGVYLEGARIQRALAAERAE